MILESGQKDHFAMFSIYAHPVKLSDTWIFITIVHTL